MLSEPSIGRVAVAYLQAFMPIDQVDRTCINDSPWFSSDVKLQTSSENKIESKVIPMHN
jgi:hypothetical protein